MVTTQQAWYKDWFNSPFYHKLYFERDEIEAKDFIYRLINHLKPAQGSVMLDAACGRGRHSKILSSMGFRVTGIDIAPDSIEYALKFENDNLEFFQHDMRLPFRINYFDYAFNNAGTNKAPVELIASTTTLNFLFSSALGFTRG